MTGPIAPFMPGLELNTRFYWEVARPLVLRVVPATRHAAALIGYGSDVLGFDTLMSIDHNWGPRLQVFLDPADYACLAPDLNALLRRDLPPSFMGYAVHYSLPDLADNGTQHMEPHVGGPVNHLITLHTVNDYTQQYLAVGPEQPLTPVDWLLIPEQKLLEFTAGRVFHDGLRSLGAARARFAYYPRDVWLCRLAAGWQRIAEEEVFLGRAGDLGDETGSWLVAARLVRRLIRLCFLYSHQYAPYSKWLGTAFSRLTIAADLAPCLEGVRAAPDWRGRESWLGRGLERLAHAHNRLGITSRIDPTLRNYFGRPFRVIKADRFSQAIAQRIDDPTLATAATSLGAVDQFTDCDAIDSSAALAARLRAVFDTQPS
jgi:hypothetical protein